MRGSDTDRQAIADQLQSLSLPELVDVLRRVLSARGSGERRNGLTHRLVLAEATIFDDTVPRTADDAPVVIIEGGAHRPARVPRCNADHRS